MNYEPCKKLIIKKCIALWSLSNKQKLKNNRGGILDTLIPAQNARLFAIIIGKNILTDYINVETIFRQMFQFQFHQGLFQLAQLIQYRHWFSQWFPSDNKPLS